jgi:hypothetical protein
MNRGTRSGTMNLIWIPKTTGYGCGWRFGELAVIFGKTR